MLKPNSKQVKEKVNNYLLECAQDCAQDYGKATPQTIEEAKTFIIEVFKNEKLSDYNYNKKEVLRRFYKNSLFEAFKDWAQGLTRCVNSYAYMLGGAVDFVGDLLEETQAERQRFSQEEAEQMAHLLLFSNLFDIKSQIDILKD